MEILNLFWGFILTIWNVNNEWRKIMNLSPIGFILTIWNVNTQFTSYHPSALSSFRLTIWT
ncbi:hypothetical protein [Clostridioides difficile]|uniref:hypothetical protein n=1 Tax=Clostridioides difficile TaxID=1496 RepID=UPI0021D20FB4|nr:hypothetical protein [Clostridioides difficile]